tara:strand:- start:3817 stop:4545 length:729 start_codon:yes stop_codon:yes gene_type:complete
MMINKDNLKIKLFADGAGLDQIKLMNELDYISGFTTNPSLIRQAGIEDYESFAKTLLSYVDKKSVSFEVFADEIEIMKKQALKIASWGNNVAVKIPITNTKGESTNELIGELTKEGISCNVTAIFTINQMIPVLEKIDNQASIIFSIFAGRIADAGNDPEEPIKEAISLVREIPKAEILWASSRELYNIIQAMNCGCHIITVGHDLLNKIDTFGKNLDQYSLETVKMFYQDALKSKYKINTK